MIPKIIHYCWFGGKEIPSELQKCIDTWQKLDGYQIIRHDESDCPFNENEFVKKAFAEKKWGFIGDYYRLKAVYETGGIYLDTDVLVNRDFEPFLSEPCFMGYFVDCCLCTAIIGGEKGASILKELMHLYDVTKFVDSDIPWRYDETEDVLYVNKMETTNYYYTWYLMNKYPELKLNNTYQKFDDITIYPKEYFEIGKLNGKHFTVHLNSGTWQNKEKANAFYAKCKKFLLSIPWLGEKIQILVRRRRYKKMAKANPFYNKR